MVTIHPGKLYVFVGGFHPHSTPCHVARTVTMDVNTPFFVKALLKLEFVKLTTL